MRRLTHAGRRGFSLVEVLVALGIFSVLAMAASPFYADYVANSRLREGGNVLLGEALFAQAEAVKRNANVMLSRTAGNGILRVFDANGNELRMRRMPGGVTASGDNSVTFGASGRPVPFGTAVSMNLSVENFTCSNDIRCPGLRVDGGGGMRLCTNVNNC